MVSGMTVAQRADAVPPVVVRSSGDIGCFTNDLKVLSRFESDTLAGPCEIDHEDRVFPLVAIGFTSAEDVLLQRVALDGTTSWTMNLAPEASAMKGAAVDFARLRIPDRVAAATSDAETTAAKSQPAGTTHLERCIVALLSDGRLSVVTANGNLLYRAELHSKGPLVSNAKDKWSAFGLAIADLDGDGEDEIYTASDSELLRLCTKR
jgi:hypothetical protein